MLRFSCHVRLFQPSDRLWTFKNSNICMFGGAMSPWPPLGTSMYVTSVPTIGNLRKRSLPCSNLSSARRTVNRALIHSALAVLTISTIAIIRAFNFDTFCSASSLCPLITRPVDFLPERDSCQIIPDAASRIVQIFHEFCRDTPPAARLVLCRH
jgi:hypothetical protein